MGALDFFIILVDTLVGNILLKSIAMFGIIACLHHLGIKISHR